ncbi:hypothetical protein [Aeromicrobium ginsengisoli]|uniref:Uncharacterized protein n=1 Tax=Aeromicrobium ginsengisoli TaxID=363867 RepID=A0A5M4FC93_9ACTN|nr:hypothetical protein [Aeromicrobium ginsengisoli]KAA1395915.1 hypothetical protein ESP70_017450 [Aeromicrobium ginsengisoli]
MPDAEHDVHAETKMTVHERDIDALAAPIAEWLGTLQLTDVPVTISDLHAPQGAGMSRTRLR